MVLRYFSDRPVLPSPGMQEKNPNPEAIVSASWDSSLITVLKRDRARVQHAPFVFLGEG